MSVLLRARISSFLTGVGLTTLACMYQLRNDISESHSQILRLVRRVGPLGVVNKGLGKLKTLGVHMLSVICAYLA